MTLEGTQDALLGGRVRLLQPEVGYRAAIDPVLLASAVPDIGRARVLDAGTGTGAVMLCLLARLPALSVCGLEINPETAELARRSLALNGWETRGEVISGDLRVEARRLGAFAAVVSNPPYHGPGTPSPDAGKALAHIEEVPLADWMDACLKRLGDGGVLALIHRADRLDEILTALHGRAGATEIVPLWPRAGQPARRVIVRTRKGRRTPAILHAGLTLHEADGGYTEAAHRLLREGHSLDAVLGL